MKEAERHLMTLFTEALELTSPGERAAYLARACGDDEALRQSVEALLRAHAQAGRFLELSGAGATGAFAPPNRPVHPPGRMEGQGAMLGAYKLLQPIGEGGMGAVWMAEQQEPVRRMVALKLIKAGMDSRQVVARFEAERQALALMDHPNIAKVLDGGATEQGRPYLVMELVKGQPITTYCDEHKLPPRQRLELFADACQAVQHAHQKGIIHRDLKPSNVLVAPYDGRPVVKVIDFGIAKAAGQKLTDKTLFTEFGAVVGTLEYMSPEQAELNNQDIDTRSDVYSLGVLLYELLTGTTPLDRVRRKETGLVDLLRAIREEEPPRPSMRLSESKEALPTISAQRQTEPAKLAKLVRGELDWIVMKALDKDRGRRYETATSFAHDIQRYLNGELVHACPPSAGYRFRKFARRNRAAVLSVAAVLLVLVAGIAGTTFGLIRAEARRTEAEEARAEEAAQREIAVAQKKKAEQAEAATLADYRASTDEALALLIGSKPRLGPQEKAYLEKSLKRWQAFAAQQGDDERSQAIRAEGHARVAYVWIKLGRGEEARREYETALALRKKLAAAYPAVAQYQYELANTHNSLGALILGQGQHKEARQEYETARDLQQKLVATFSAEPRYQRELAVTHLNLGMLWAHLGQQEKARKEYQLAHDLQTKLVAAFPAVPEYKEDLARAHVALANLLAKLGRRDAARKEYQAVRDLQQKLVAAFPAVPEYQAALAITHNNLGMTLAALGQHDAARKEYETARDWQKKLVAAFPALPQYWEALASTHYSLGLLWTDLGRYGVARTEHQASLDLRKKLTELYPALPEGQWELALSYNGLAIVLANLRQYEASREAFETARDLYKKVVAAQPTVPKYQQELAATHNNLGKLLLILGKPDAARTELESAREVHKKLVAAFPAVPQYQIQLGVSYNNFGALVRAGGKPAESLQWFDLAIRTLTPLYEQDRRQVAARQFLRNGHFNRAVAYDQLKKHAEAVKDWNKAVELTPNSEQPPYRAYRATSRVQAGETAAAVAEVAQLTKASNWSAHQWYDFACVYAVASTRIADQKQAYADRAMELLRQAVKTGYKNAAHMAKDPDFVSLRQRTDFQKLLAVLTGGKK